MKPSVSSAEGRRTWAHLSRYRPRDPVTSGRALLTHKPTMCFTSSNFSVSHAGVPLPRPHLTLLKRGEQ